MATYNLDNTQAQYAIALLTGAFPQARFSAGSDPYQLLAWASPKDQAKIAAAVEKLAAETDESASTLAVYNLEGRDAQNVLQVLRAAVPQAQFSVGADGRSLLAWARPKDHGVIRTAVEQIQADTSLVDERTMAVYPLKGSDAASLIQVLQPVIQDHAQIATDRSRNSLIVWADKQYHEAIKKTIEDFTQQVTGIEQATSRVYRFQTADPQAAYSVLRTLVPEASIALDETNRSLVVSAMPEDHEKIQATVDEMDREDQSQASRMELYPVTAADPAVLMRTLQELYRRRPDVQIALDQDSGSVIAFATPFEQKKIRELIERIERLAAGDSAARLKLYSLENVDSAAALEVLTSLMEKQGAKVQLSVEPRSNQLVAFARPEQHSLIESTIEELRGEEPQFEIFQLDMVDPTSAEMAITRLFSDDYWNAPMVDIDPVTQQLFVRGKPDQLQEIRQLLIKMGETGLAVTPGRTSRNLRTIRFNGDVQAAIAEIQRVWPQLRPNDIRVFSPTGTAPGGQAAGPSREKAAASPQLKKLEQSEPDNPFIEEKKSADKPAAEPAKPAEGKSEAAKTENPNAKEAKTAESASRPDKPPERPVEPAGGKTSQRDLPRNPVFRLASYQEDSAGETDEAEAAEPSQPISGAMAEPAGKSPAAAVQAAPAPSAPAAQQPAASNEKPATMPSDIPAGAVVPRSPPVIIVPGDGQITIASDDPEALDQLEALLRSLAEPSGQIGRNFHVFPLKHTNAFDVAQTVQDLFRENQNRYGWRRGLSPVVVVPDERMNAILVQANRTDRTTIENLLKVLDTDEVPASPDAQRPRIIPVHNTDAERVEEVVRDVFRSQLAVGSRRQSSDGSSGRWMPQVTVDEVTNSLVVMAPAPLIDDITELVQSLDEAAANDPARTVTIIPLQKTNASRVQKALDEILRSGNSRRSRRSSSP
jgi:type II secretory pathway component GspD/PulD (secretin)